jgi:rhodanese-related sulfurtransferase
VRIDELLAKSRELLERVVPEDLFGLQQGGALVVDIRPEAQRRRDGVLPGALVIDRNVLEWRLAPSSPNRVAELAEGQKVIVVCNQGYSSSLAASTLRILGLSGATDMVGGFAALKALQLSAPNRPVSDHPEGVATA